MSNAPPPPCPDCNGSGQEGLRDLMDVWTEGCRVCDGSGSTDPDWLPQCERGHDVDIGQVECHVCPLGIWEGYA